MALAIRGCYLLLYDSSFNDMDSLGLRGQLGTCTDWAELFTSLRQPSHSLNNLNFNVSVRTTFIEEHFYFR